ncbi:MAG: LUD domain-containing protein [Chloroflexi bacterium]|nr:LUD domain-containing protein [Chloroflexota bacterium]
MTADRDSILDIVRRSLPSARLPGARAALPPRAIAPTPLDTAALVGSFTRELAALRGNTHGPQTAGQATETVIGLLREAGGDEILAWADAALPIAGLGEAIRRAGFKTLDAVVPADAEGWREKQTQLSRASAGVTGALAGLADTGSIVVASGPSRPRLASLLPPTHIAVLPVADLYPTLPEFFAARPGLARAGSNVVIITGPSRTADIELTPVYGVHGPKVLHVVLLSRRP